MIKVLKLTTLSAFLLFATVSTTHAAFPKDKATTSTTVVTNEPISSELNEAPATKADLKKELNSLKKETSHFRGGSGGKSKMTAALLCFALGTFGIHSFYMGKKQKGLIQLALGGGGWLLYIIGILSSVNSITISPLVAIGGVMLFAAVIWAIIDFVRILTGGLAPEEGFDS